MSTVPLATVALPTLADAVDESLAAALADHAEPCLWCGSRAVSIVSADFWSGRVVVRCHECGSELSGAVPRRLRGAAG
jgi:hypothetical protein